MKRARIKSACGCGLRIIITITLDLLKVQSLRYHPYLLNQNIHFTSPWVIYSHFNTEETLGWKTPTSNLLCFKDLTARYSVVGISSPDQGWQ